MSIKAKQTLEGSVTPSKSLEGSVTPSKSLEGSVKLGKPLATVEVSEIEGGHKITVTDPNGVQELVIEDGKDGKDGIDGVDGKDGYTPVKGKDYFDGRDGIDGKDGKDGYTPVKGKDYFDGEKGDKGDRGDAGYTPIKGVDYFDGQKGEKGDKGDTGEVTWLYASNNFVNALKNTVSGNPVAISDVSPLEHELVVKTEGATTVTRCGKNLIGYVYTDTKAEINGVEFTVNDDGSITIEGTNTTGESAIFYLNRKMMVDTASKYTVSVTGCKNSNVRGLSPTKADFEVKSNNQQIQTFTPSGNTLNVLVYVRSGVTVSETLTIQIELGTEATEYEPYKEPQTVEVVDGTVTGLLSLSPSMTLIADAGTIEVEYNRDVNKAIINEGGVTEARVMELLEENAGDEVTAESIKTALGYTPANESSVPTKVSQLTNDSGYLTSVPDEYVTETELAAKGYLTAVPSEYVTETELSARKYLTSIPSEYVTETELAAKGYLTQHQDLSAYAKTTNHYTKTETDNKYQPQGSYLTAVPSEYVTETELNAKGYLTAVPSEYITETELSAKKYLTAVPSEYVTDSELNAKGYATQSSVDSLTEEIDDYNILNPDSFEGTDSEKLQACFDALETTGGVISINRTYTLTDNIKIKHNSGSSSQIIVRGTGKVAGIDFGNYSFVGYDTTTKGYGGVVFEHLRLNGDGTNIGFNMNQLIRLFFNSCVIRRFTNFIYADKDYIQTVYINDCVIRHSLGATVKIAEDCTDGRCYDVRIVGCLAEGGAGLFDVPKTVGCAIVQNCIESYSATPIIVRKDMYVLDISSNYFETNGEGISIDFSGVSASSVANINSNNLIENSPTRGAILLPKTLTTGSLIISSNRGTIIAEVPSGATDLSGVYYFGNNGDLINTNEKLTPVVPKDIVSMLGSRVVSVNGQIGEVVLSASDIGAVNEAYVDNAITNLNAQGIQQTPLFASTTGECTDTTKVYVLPDGDIYGYMRTMITIEPENEIPKATDTDRKTIYNGKGYQLGKRINSSGNVVDYSGDTLMGVTGFIPAKVGDVIDVTGYGYNNNYTTYVAGYDSSNNCTGKLTITASTKFPITLDSATFGSNFNAIRVSGNITDSTSIINKSTGGTTSTYEWKSTGHKFVPADYEDRILALEQKIAKLEG